MQSRLRILALSPWCLAGGAPLRNSWQRIPGTEKEKKKNFPLFHLTFLYTHTHTQHCCLSHTHTKLFLKKRKCFSPEAKAIDLCFLFPLFSHSHYEDFFEYNIRRRRRELGIPDCFSSRHHKTCFLFKSTKNNF